MTPDEVPAELVEQLLGTRLPSGGYATLNEPQARVLLAAVMPTIIGQALRDAAEFMTTNTPPSTDISVDFVVKWLNGVAREVVVPITD